MDYLSGIDLLTNSRTGGGAPPLVDDGVPQYQALRISAGAMPPTAVTRTSSICSVDKNTFAVGDADSVDEMIALTNLGGGPRGGGGDGVAMSEASVASHSIADVHPYAHVHNDGVASSVCGSDPDDGNTVDVGDDDASSGTAASDDASSEGAVSSEVATARHGGFNNRRNHHYHHNRRGSGEGSQCDPPYEDITLKKQLIYRLDRMAQRGMHMPKRYTMKDSLEEIQAEYDRLKQNRDMDASVRFQRRMLVACVTGIEFLNGKFDPFDIRLNGWSDSINENIDDYDDIFEELFLKYRGKAKMAPELNLMLMVGGSGLMFHLTNSMFRSSNMPDMADVMKRNPDLMRQFANATLETMHNPNQGPHAGRAPPPVANKPRGGGGGIMSAIGSMFGIGGGGGGLQPTVMVSQSPAGGGGGGGHAQTQSFMRGPKNVDEILRDLQKDAFSTPSAPQHHPQRPASPTFSVGEPDAQVIEAIAASSSGSAPPKKRAPRANAKRAGAAAAADKSRRTIDI